MSERQIENLSQYQHHLKTSASKSDQVEASWMIRNQQECYSFEPVPSPSTATTWGYILITWIMVPYDRILDLIETFHHLTNSHVPKLTHSKAGMRIHCMRWWNTPEFSILESLRSGSDSSYAVDHRSRNECVHKYKPCAHMIGIYFDFRHSPLSRFQTLSPFMCFRRLYMLELF